MSPPNAGGASRLPPFDAEVFAPSDVEGLPSARFFVGGRVLAVGATELRLADAFSSISVDFSENVLPSLAPGNLAVLELERSGSTLHLVGVRFSEPRPEPKRFGEFDRFTLGGAGRVLRARNDLLKIIRGYFEEERFVEVTTPAFADCPGLDENVDSLGTVTIGSEELHLVTSPEFHLKRMLVGGFPRLFEIAASHRAGELGAKHEPVFTLVEWYRAFSNYESILNDSENLVRRAAHALSPDGSLHVARGDAECIFSIDSPFERISVREAFSRFAGISDVRALLLASKERFFQTLVDDVEPELAKIPRPVFLLDYPIELGALAQPRSDDPNYAERFELYVGGVELSNGYGELTDSDVQRTRFERELSRRTAENAPRYPLPEPFLASLDEGMPPASGNALGLERLLMVTLGLSSIENAVAFPRSRAHHRDSNLR